MGTVNAFESTRCLPGLGRFSYVSSGAVYGEALPGTPDVPVPEHSHLAPVEFNGITKYASGLITRRRSAAFGLDALAVRLSGVSGPMDRITPARNVQCIPHRIAHLALASRSASRPWRRVATGSTPRTLPARWPVCRGRPSADTTSITAPTASLRSFANSSALCARSYPKPRSASRPGRKRTLPKTRPAALAVGLQTTSRAFAPMPAGSPRSSSGRAELYQLDTGNRVKRAMGQAPRFCGT